MNSDVTRFTTYESNLPTLATNQVVAGCENVLQKIASSYTFFAAKSVYVARLPAQAQLVFQKMT